MPKTSKLNPAIRDGAIAHLKHDLPEGGTVYTLIASVALSGMSAKLCCFIVADGKPFHIDHMVQAVLKGTYNETESRNVGVTVKGYGFDRGASLVQSLSMALYGKPDALKHDRL